MVGRIPSSFVYLLLGSIFGLLAFTASGYVGCTDLCPDELLDLVFESPNPISPVFESHLEIHPLPISSLEVYYFQKVNLLTNVLRC
jgi:hypothetical protein